MRKSEAKAIIKQVCCEETALGILSQMEKKGQKWDPEDFPASLFCSPEVPGKLLTVERSSFNRDLSYSELQEAVRRCNLLPKLYEVCNLEAIKYASVYAFASRVTDILKGKENG
jgi:hypothetical protein